MSWLSKAAKKVKKTVTKASGVVPGLALVAPIGGKKQLAAAQQGLATGAALAGGGSLGGGAPVPPAPSGVPMSLNSGDWGALLGQTLGGVQAGKGVLQPGGLGSSVITNLLPALVAKRVAKNVVPAVTGAAVGLGLEGLLDAGAGLLDFGTKKRRRINPLNVRAARRAIRRIKAVRKITASIERSLPKAKARMTHTHPFARKR